MFHILRVIGLLQNEQDCKKLVLFAGTEGIFLLTPLVLECRIRIKPYAVFFP